MVLPISFFERAGRAYFNTIAILDADGANLGIYRKSHIPNGPGYQEKTYFSPGDTGFKVWNTRFARIGVGICWDQWFPETARVMALMGAELFFFPTAIGSEPPPAPPVNSREHWQRTQQGHAAANLTPLVAANRYGLERSLQDPEKLYIRFYGSSFIADGMGAKVAEAKEEGDAVLVHTFDLEAAAQLRDNWFVFRDRRPELYGADRLAGRARRGRVERAAQAASAAGPGLSAVGSGAVPGPFGPGTAFGGGGGTAHPWLSPRAGLCLHPHACDGTWMRSVLSGSQQSEPDPSARPGGFSSSASL